MEYLPYRILRALILLKQGPPVLNLFHPSLIGSAIIVTLFIIFVETFVLYRFIRQVSFFQSLLRVVLINAVSSAIASLVILNAIDRRFSITSFYTVILPLYGITLLTEIPMLWVFYRDLPLSIGRAIRLGIGVNTFSYLVLFIWKVSFWVLFPLLIGFPGGHEGPAEDEYFRWNHPEMLEHAEGWIYEAGGSDHGAYKDGYHFSCYDLSVGEWITPPNLNHIDPHSWDAEGSLLAWVSGKTSQRITVASVPDLTPKQEIGLPDLISASETKRRSVVSQRISPNGKYLAILVTYGLVCLPKDERTEYCLGSKCRLAIVDIESGNRVLTLRQWVIDSDLCWFPDSSQLIVSCLKDTSLYEIPWPTEKHYEVLESVDHRKPGPFTRALYSVDIRSGSVSFFADAYHPSASPSAGKILFDRSDRRVIYDFATRVEERLDLIDVGWEPQLSPDGKFLLTSSSREALFGTDRLLVLTDMRDHSRRHCIKSPDVVMRVDWVSGHFPAEAP